MPLGTGIGFCVSGGFRYETPQGVICMVKQFHYSLEDLISPAKGEAPLCMALENLQDPGNLGTILRTGEGAA